jgi:hypothetical protein
VWLARECMFPFKSPCNQLHLLRENKRKEAQVRVLKLCVFIVSSVRVYSSSSGHNYHAGYSDRQDDRYDDRRDDRQDGNQNNSGNRGNYKP